SLDEKFALRERVTTSLLLTPEQYAEPAAQALLLDVDQRVARLDVPARFPIRLSWWAVAVPTLAVALTLIAVYYDVHLSPNPSPSNQDLAQAPPNLPEIEEKLKDLNREPNRKPEEAPSEQLKEFDEELKNLANKPHNTKDDLRDRFNEIDPIEKKMEE